MEFEQGRSVTPGPESVVGIRNSRFPEVVGRTKPEELVVSPVKTALEIATTLDPMGREVVDPVILRSVGNMDGGE